ncbi:hypothetical protein LOK74_23445 [Brevibacillus humidisoli]|uniref:hypothetical protein n=1 Tax=Brevibacillus humidisoli TaxID=2895522 RepID=UPI001E3FEDCB|nr:hypothetical protein [Brevibacillus humidisoli]UFJ40906.1 hypothetical protein LOK74_23445 [Brevibacillus humidisoli]
MFFPSDDSADQAARKKANRTIKTFRKSMIHFMISVFLIILCVISVGMGAWSQREEATTSPIFYQDKALVLIYHQIVSDESPAKGNPSTVTVGLFREHLHLLKKEGFQIDASSDPAFVSRGQTAYGNDGRVSCPH